VVLLSGTFSGQKGTDDYSFATPVHSDRETLLYSTSVLLHVQYVRILKRLAQKKKTALLRETLSLPLPIPVVSTVQILANAPHHRSYSRRALMAGRRLPFSLLIRVRDIYPCHDMSAHAQDHRLV
jgi:hypothetical protein